MMLFLSIFLWTVLYLFLVVCILRDNADPDMKLICILLIGLLPPVGIILYLLMGINYRRKGKPVYELDPDLAAQVFPEDGDEILEPAYRPLAKLIRGCGEGNRILPGNDFEIITSGLRKRELLLADLRNAKRFIHIEYFRFGNDEAGREVRDLLLEKAKEGVEVRLVHNNMIGRNIPASYWDEMEKGGIQIVHWTHIRLGFGKWLMRINHQNHRKIVVIDGQVAYTGGMNLNDNYFYHWRDTHIRVTGPAVSRLNALFVESWYACNARFNRPLDYYFCTEAIPNPEAPLKGKTLQIMGDSADYPWPTTLLAYEWILANARDYVYLQTPYFIPPTSLMQALQSAALRGVDVRLMLPLDVDTKYVGPGNKSCYKECLEAGIRIYQRGGSFIHSKTLVCDDALSIIGASNLDQRSFFINREVNTLVYDRETALANKEIFLNELELTQEVLLPEWLQQQSFFKRLGQDIMRVLYRGL